MDLHDQRMQCLKMAFELGGKPEAILNAAQQLLDFVTGPPQPDVAVPAGPHIGEALVSEPETPTDAVPDPIAACGTALVMPDGSELADAMPTPGSPIAVEPEVAASETEFEAAPSDASSEAPKDSASPSELTEPTAELSENAAAIEAVGEGCAEVATNEEPTTEITTEAADMSSTPSDVDGNGEAATSVN